MKIGPDEVRHVAGLAEVALTDAEIPVLAAQLEAIVAFVAQLNEVPDGNGPSGVPSIGPGSVSLREDVVRPIPMTRTPEQMAPAFQHGFYVVPRLGGLANE